MAPIEPPDLELAPDLIGGATSARGYRVRAPPAITPDQISVGLLPVCGYPGRIVRVYLWVSEDDGRRSPCDHAIAVGIGAAHVRVTARIVGGPATVTPIPAFVSTCVAKPPGSGGVELCMLVPGDASATQIVFIDSIDFGGIPILGASAVKIPIVQPAGLTAQAVSFDDPVGCGADGLAVSLSGSVFVATRFEPFIQVFSADGHRAVAPPVDFDGLGLAGNTITMAVDSGTHSVLLTSHRRDAVATRVVSVDASSGAMRWSTDAIYLNCFSMAAMSSRGVIFVDSYDGDDLTMLHALRASDGVRLSSTPMRRGAWQAIVAADETNGLVLASLLCSAIDVFRWTGSTLEPCPSIHVTDDSDPRTLAVVPPARGKRMSHLVVGGCGGPFVGVYSLPGGEYLGSFQLGQSRWTDIDALAADAGGASVTYAHNHDIHVVPWPFEGMPPIS